MHPVLDAARPFAGAEVISTGKGLLDRVATVVAGVDLNQRPSYGGVK
jgi:hypothetical protein